MKRHRMSKRQNKKSFRRGTRINPLNGSMLGSRGGIRL